MKGLRTYRLMGFEYDNPLVVDVDLHDIFCPKENDFEYIYALGDSLDAILKMDIGEVWFVHTNRDYKECKGVLKRIK